MWNLKTNSNNRKERNRLINMENELAVARKEGGGGGMREREEREEEPQTSGYKQDKDEKYSSGNIANTIGLTELHGSW